MEERELRELINTSGYEGALLHLNERLRKLEGDKKPQEPEAPPPPPEQPHQ